MIFRTSEAKRLSNRKPHILGRHGSVLDQIEQQSASLDTDPVKDNTLGPMLDRYMRRGWGAPPHPPRRVGSPAPPCGGGLGAGVVHIKFPLPGIWTSSFSVQGVSILTFFTKLCFAKAFAQRFSYPKPPDFLLKCFWVAPHSGAH